MKIRLLLVAALVAACTLVGCSQYDTPEYVEIGNNETAYLVTLEGSPQAKKNVSYSVDDLKQMELPPTTKRVQIPHRWNKLGYWYRDGVWIPIVRVLVVNRTPETREWEAEAGKGTSKNNEALWIESSDSIEFSCSITCTAMIKPEDASMFLFYYPTTVSGKSDVLGERALSRATLAPIMDGEIRGRIQSSAAEFCSGLAMTELRTKKKEMLLFVQEQTVAFFAERGISITNLGLGGGFVYRDQKIQDSINENFVAQQLMVVNKAKLDAQEDDNKRVRLAAEAQGDAMAEVELRAAKGVADGMREIAKAASEAQTNPLFYKLRVLETLNQAVDKWDGSVPRWLFMPTGNGNGIAPPAMLLNIPAEPDVATSQVR